MRLGHTQTGIAQTETWPLKNRHRFHKTDRNNTASDRGKIERDMGGIRTEKAAQPKKWAQKLKTVT